MQTSDYLEQLQQDKSDLVDNLTTMGIEDLTGDETFTELVPEVLNISGVNLPTSFEEFTEFIKLSFIIKKYDVYTNDSVNLYAPADNKKYYIIGKKSNGKYRIAWTGFPFVIVSNSFSFHSFDIDKLYPNFNYIVENFTDANRKDTFYYSTTEFDTAEEAVQALMIQNNDIAYATYSGNSLQGVPDTQYLVPYTNMIIFDKRTRYDLTSFDGLTTLGRRISKNETILLRNTNSN